MHVEVAPLKVYIYIYYLPFSLTAANPFDQKSGVRGSSYKGRWFSSDEGVDRKGVGARAAAKPLRRKRTKHTSA